MSFASDVKGELARLTIEKKCCMLAEISGFLRVSGSVRLSGGGKFSIVSSTENAAIARHYKKLIKNYFGSRVDLEVGDSRVPGKSNRGYNRYYLTIGPEEKASQILRETGIMLVKEGNDYFSDGIYQPIVRTKCCKKSYLRGIFLGCGTMSDPKKSYSMEFVVESEKTANDLRKLIGSFVDLSAKVVKRKESYVVYLKKASYVKDMLGIMGADDALLEMTGIMINKEIVGDAQRLMNCDNANVDRTLAASEEQFRWIKTIEDAEGLERLPAPLLEVARLRLERPAASLSEIGEALNPPIRKPGVSKRFSKIKAIAEEIGKKNGKE
ncbi:MAG TPA: DNA-binding protein WhiA [Mogibacterium sp.]|nr:DNA-binding protein WhiA [Mogibacterium sp.]